MRLAKVENGHRLRHKAMLGMMRLITGARAQDVIRTMLYRPEFFGAPSFKLSQAVLRGDSDWSVGERELFAAFTANLNKCRF